MVIFIGQVARDQEYREAFQEVDYHKFYGAICKEVVQIDHADRVPELVSQAFHVAASGRPRPRCRFHSGRHAARYGRCGGRATVHHGSFGSRLQAMADFRAQLVVSERPLMIVGGAGWSEKACADIPKHLLRPMPCRLRPRSAAKTCSTICTRTMRASWAQARARN